MCAPPLSRVGGAHAGVRDPFLCRQRTCRFVCPSPESAAQMQTCAPLPPESAAHMQGRVGHCVPSPQSAAHICAQTRLYPISACSQSPAALTGPLCAAHEIIMRANGSLRVTNPKIPLPATVFFSSSHDSHDPRTRTSGSLGIFVCTVAPSLIWDCWE